LLEAAIEPALIEALNAALLRLERDLDAKPAMNGFEGHRTVRIYNLLARGAPFEKVPDHASVLPIVEGVLDAGCLISSRPPSHRSGRDRQPIHAMTWSFPWKPHRPIVWQFHVALTDFTAANGATRLVRQHLMPSPEYGGAYETIPAEMWAGDVLIWDGPCSTAGANTTAKRRTGVAMNYCAGFIRQQRNQQLGLDPAWSGPFRPACVTSSATASTRASSATSTRRVPAQPPNDSADFKSIWDR